MLPGVSLRPPSIGQRPGDAPGGNSWHSVGALFVLCPFPRGPPVDVSPLCLCDWTPEMEARSGFHVAASRHVANRCRAHPPRQWLSQALAALFPLLFRRPRGRAQRLPGRLCRLLETGCRARVWRVPGEGASICISRSS